MTAVTRDLNESKIKEVAEEYARAGFEVTIEPDPASFPFELGDYRPDIIARKDDQGLIIEIKSTAQRISADRLKSVAEQVSQHEGWRFLLVTADDSPGTALPGVDSADLSWAEISQRIENSKRLESSGEQEAAFITLWIAFEHLIRTQALRTAIPFERLPSQMLIRHLYSFGELTMTQFDAALECQRVRNQVVHGLKSPGFNDVMDRLKKLVDELCIIWKPELPSAE